MYRRAKNLNVDRRTESRKLGITEFQTCWKQYIPLKLLFAGGGWGAGGISGYRPYKTVTMWLLLWTDLAHWYQTVSQPGRLGLIHSVPSQSWPWTWYLTSQPAQPRGQHLGLEMALFPAIRVYAVTQEKGPVKFSQVTEFLVPTDQPIWILFLP